MQIVSSIVEYDEYIEHLDLLITSLQSHHKKKSKVDIYCVNLNEASHKINAIEKFNCVLMYLTVSV